MAKLVFHVFRNWTSGNVNSMTQFTGGFHIWKLYYKSHSDGAAEMFHMQYVKIRLLNVAILTSMISFQINSAVPIINTLQYAARDIEDHDPILGEQFGKWMD